MTLLGFSASQVAVASNKMQKMRAESFFLFIKMSSDTLLKWEHLVLLEQTGLEFRKNVPSMHFLAISVHMLSDVVTQEKIFRKPLKELNITDLYRDGRFEVKWVRLPRVIRTIRFSNWCDCRYYTMYTTAFPRHSCTSFSWSLKPRQGNNIQVPEEAFQEKHFIFPKWKPFFESTFFGKSSMDGAKGFLNFERKLEWVELFQLCWERMTFR